MSDVSKSLVMTWPDLTSSSMTWKYPVLNLGREPQIDVLPYCIFILNKTWRKGSSKINNLQWFFSRNVSHPLRMFFSSHYKFRDIDKDVLHFYYSLVWWLCRNTGEDSINTPALGCTFNLFHKCIPRCGLCGIWFWSDPADDESIDTADTEWWECWWSVNHFVSPSLSSSLMRCSELNWDHNPWWHY